MASSRRISWVHVDGRVPLGGSFKLRYDVESANARAPTRDAVVNAFDALETKAVNARLRVEAPVASATLVLGGNVLFDHIPQNADHPELDERILGVHGAYVGPRLSVIAELYDIHHEGPTGNGSSTRAGFAQLGYRTFADITPYVVFDFVDYPEGGDPYFIGERSHVTATAGARWLAAEAMALKLQASRTAGDLAESRFSAQFAFGF